MYRRQGYKHAPVTFSLCPSLAHTYKEIAGDTPLPVYFDYPEGFATQEIPRLSFRPRDSVDWTKYYDVALKEGTTFNAYGVAFEPGSAAAQHMTYMRHPLRNATSLEEMEAYPFPSYDSTHTEYIQEAVHQAHKAGLAAVGCAHCTIWETAWYIRDMTQLMMDMCSGDEKATFILDVLTEHAVQCVTAYARAGADIIELGDDIGMQTTLMMSKEMYDMWLKPRLARVISAAKKENPDVLIYYHTCGYVEPLIPRLIEAGIDILNPVQPECMTFSEIHARYGDRLAFNGTIGTQTTMPFGTPQDVRNMVWHNLSIAGEKGGLLCCPTHLLEPEVPWENVEAYVRACREWRA